MIDYIVIDGELYHHGVKGMKWGIVRSKNQKASGYSTKQRIRDRKLYGRSAEKKN